MTLRRVGEIFYGFYLHYHKNYNFSKYKYKIPSSHENMLINYIKANKGKLLQFVQYGESSVRFLGIINQLKFDAGYSVHEDLSDVYIKPFIQSLINIVPLFKVDIETIVSGCNNIYDVFKLYESDKINWFTPPLIFGFCKFDKTKYINDILIENDLYKLTRTLILFDIIDDKKQELLNVVEPLQKKIDLGEFK